MCFIPSFYVLVATNVGFSHCNYLKAYLYQLNMFFCYSFHPLFKHYLAFKWYQCILIYSALLLILVNKCLVYHCNFVCVIELVVITQNLGKTSNWS